MHFIGGWVGRTGGLDEYKKPLTLGFDSRTFQFGILKSDLLKTTVVY
jgi:hypothetical protein